MRASLAATVICVIISSATPASAQVEPFVTGAVHRDLNAEHFGGAGGGVLVTARWVSVGAQGDAFFSAPYVAGRFTLLAQGNLVDVAGVRPFVQVGTSFGEFKGRMWGAGVDVRRASSRIGLRAMVQTYYARMWMGETRAQPSVHLGVIWRLGP